MSSSRVELYRGLEVLVSGTFPRTCGTCGREYSSLEQLLEQTTAAGAGSGLKQSWDDDERPLVELFRNCVCGSTLMDTCADRRDDSADGERRRRAFDRFHELLQEHGLDAERARAQLRLLLRGEKCEIAEVFAEFLEREGG